MEAIQFYEALHKRHYHLAFTDPRYKDAWRWAMPGQFRKAIGDAARKYPDDLWECNHKVPLSEGGDLCDLENLETLCVPCHKAHTAQLMGRLAKARRRRKKFHNGSD